MGDDRVAAIRPLPMRQGDNGPKLVREGEQIFVAGQMGRLSKYTSWRWILNRVDGGHIVLQPR
jgi:hypothetical protein